MMMVWLFALTFVLGYWLVALCVLWVLTRFDWVMDDLARVFVSVLWPVLLPLLGFIKLGELVEGSGKRARERAERRLEEEYKLRRAQAASEDEARSEAAKRSAFR